MASRRQKRPESDDKLPADKRACSSLGSSTPSSSNSPPQIAVNTSKSESGGGDVEAYSASASGQSEGDSERDGSSSATSDFDHYNEGDPSHRVALARVQRERSHSDQEKMNRLIPILNDHLDPSVQLTSLTELCDVLSFSSDDSISSSIADQLAAVLVKLANHESSPDIMLLSIRAITYLCDDPRGLTFLIRHNAVSALCQRLTVIEYLDVAEQCLQALKRISCDQPLVCLQSGAILAVLLFIDFFSTNIQRTALSTVVNICTKLPSEGSAPIMEAVPRLCGLLHYEDGQIVESAITCLIKIADRVKDSPEKLSELCKHGLVEQTVHLIGVNGRTTLSQTTYTSLIGLLAKLVARSSDAVSMVLELDIGSMLINILSSYELSHGVHIPSTGGSHNNQVHEVLRLLNELLPSTIRHQEDQLSSAKEKILADHPNGLRKFGMEVLPVLIQLVNSGANLFVCYGCLSVISKVVYHSKSDRLFEMVESTGMLSFLMGVFTRKDYHILTLAIEITETLLQKLSDILMAVFAKEGIFFAVDALLTPGKSSVFMVPSASEISTPSDCNLNKCLCYAFSIDDCVSKSESTACKLDKDSVKEVAKRIKEKYFASGLHSLGSVDPDLLQNLREVSSELTSLIYTIRNGGCEPSEEKLNSVLHHVMVLISGDEPISTFELTDSGIIKALINYLYVGLYEGEKINLSEVFGNFDLLVERFEVFSSFSLSSFNPALKDSPLCLLVRKLQIALSTMESFPATSGKKNKQRTSYASVPHGRAVPYPCLRVCFKRAEVEKDLAEYSEAAVTVEPFCSVVAIKSYLLPEVSKRNISSSPDTSESDSLPELEEETEKATETANLASMDMDIDGSKSTGSPLSGSAGLEPHHPMEVDAESESLGNGTSSECQSNDEGSQSDVSSNAGNDFSMLAIYLEGSELDNSSTLYQEVLTQRMKSQDVISGADVCSEVCTLIYKSAAHTRRERVWQQYSPFSYDMVVPEILSGTVRSSPTNDILFLLRSLEIINRYASYLGNSERANTFAKGKCIELHTKSVMPKLPLNEFVNSKLSEKLEQQMLDPGAVSVASMPLWCSWLMYTCPFLFTFEARCKFFKLAAFGRPCTEPQSPHNDSDRRGRSRGLPRKKYLVSRECILKSAMKMMDKHAQQNTILEVEYREEVGTGLGPTLEFYTLVCHEFQKPGLGMWRGDYQSSDYVKSEIDMSSEILASSTGLFPRPWSDRTDTPNARDITDVIKRFSLLGWIVAKALQDRRVLDIPFSKAFYKLILGQDLNLYDIHSFDSECGRALLELHAIGRRQKFQKDAHEEDVAFELDLTFQGMRIEDLSLDFTLPGYPDYVLADKEEHSVVTIGNLEEYVSRVVDATLNAGICRQVEAFKSGFNKVFPISHLRVFNEDELERLLCGEQNSWVSPELLDHIKLDHGYTASSTPILYLMEIIQDFSYEQRRAFLQFVTGAPRLPPGGLGTLNPKLTIVRKHCINSPDSELPSVMTCTNYFKLPPYSSKERMKGKLLYAITEGRGSFHLS